MTREREREGFPRCWSSTTSVFLNSQGTVRNIIAYSTYSINIISYLPQWIVSRHTNNYEPIDLFSISWIIANSWNSWVNKEFKREKSKIFSTMWYYYYQITVSIAEWDSLFIRIFDRDLSCSHSKQYDTSSPECEEYICETKKLLWKPERNHHDVPIAE